MLQPRSGIQVSKDLPKRKRLLGKTLLLENTIGNKGLHQEVRTKIPAF